MQTLGHFLIAIVILSVTSFVWLFLAMGIRAETELPTTRNRSIRDLREIDVISALIAADAWPIVCFWLHFGVPPVGTLVISYSMRRARYRQLSGANPEA
jgi:hypothetical protein